MQPSDPETRLMTAGIRRGDPAERVERRLVPSVARQRGGFDGGGNLGGSRKRRSEQGHQKDDLTHRNTSTTFRRQPPSPVVASLCSPVHRGHRGMLRAVHELLVFGAACVAGAINSVAGGGTLITVPMLIWLGIPAISANATSTVAL